MNFEELDRRLNSAINIKELWLETYLDVYRYVTPNRDDRNLYGDYVNDAKSRTIDIHDPTAMLAAYQRANELQGLIIPESRTWGNFEVAKNISNPINQIDLDDFNSKINDALNSSDLQVASGGAFLDLTIGMGALYARSPSDEIPLSFKAISSLAVYPEFTTENLIDTVWTKHALTGRQILDNYKKYKGTQKSVLLSKPEDVFFVWIGEVKEKDKYFTYTVLDSDRLTPLFEEEKSYKRFTIFRDRVRPGEVQGRGIAMDLFPHIRDLNTLVGDFKKVMDYKANPPMFYDTSSKFNPYAVQNSISGAYLPMVNGRPPIEAMQTPEAPEVIEIIRDMRNAILEGFKIDELGDIQSPVRSATEVSIRENRAQRTSATNIARLILEFPKEIYKTSAHILNDRQLLGNKIDINDKRLRFNYTSPLLDIQKQSNLASLEQLTEYIQKSFGENAVLSAFNLKELIPFINENFNLPHNIINSGDDIQSGIEKVLQQSQQQQQQPVQPISAEPVASPQTLI
jgi:hypothetical protein